MYVHLNVWTGFIYIQIYHFICYWSLLCDYEESIRSRFFETAQTILNKFQ
jgi:hypothetical protein